MREKKKEGITLYVLLIVIILGAATLSGFFTKIKSEPKPLNVPITLTCCDSGDGENCKPQTEGDQKITFGGKEYGKIRTKVRLLEKNLHLIDSGDKLNNDPIILNSSETHHVNPSSPNDTMPEIIDRGCNRVRPTPMDLYFKKAPPYWDYFMRANEDHSAELPQYCTSVLNDQMIFVCKKNCFNPPPCRFPDGFGGTFELPCYGDDNSEYDVYFRLEDYQNSGIPDFIKNCDRSMGSQPLPSGSTGQQKIIIRDNTGPKDNLQLKDFIIQLEENINPWLSPLCKPAIYLYPENKTDVDVKIAPKGKLTLTIPNYPNDGWKVTAYPDGKIIADNKTYDYLYYEARIPNGLIEEKVKQGSVIKYQETENTLKSILPNLGLNEKETREFLDYWLKALPKSNYYFVGVVPQSLLDEVSPLNINPKPDRVIRVALYFKPLDSSTNLPNLPNLPNWSNLSNLIERNGFTVVEWGGFFKTDNAHPFTCLM